MTEATVAMSAPRIEASPPMFRNAPLTFILYLLLIPVFGLGLLLFLGWYLKAKNTRLVVDADDIFFETGIFSKNRTQLNISSIRSVNVQQSFLQRMMDTGTILCFSAGDAPELVMSGMPNPSGIRERILGRVGDYG